MRHSRSIDPNQTIKANTLAIQAKQENEHRNTAEPEIRVKEVNLMQIKISSNLKADHAGKRF